MRSAVAERVNKFLGWGKSALACVRMVCWFLGGRAGTTRGGRVRAGGEAGAGQAGWSARPLDVHGDSAVDWLHGEAAREWLHGMDPLAEGDAAGVRDEIAVGGVGGGPREGDEWVEWTAGSGWVGATRCPDLEGDALGGYEVCREKVGRGADPGAGFSAAGGGAAGVLLWVNEKM
jgi:hypothetical protein